MELFQPRINESKRKDIFKISDLISKYDALDLQLDTKTRNLLIIMLIKIIKK